MLIEASFQIYSAAAGSGKTYTLAKTYLGLLLRSSDTRIFQHILALTFTNKAAAEMKERVLSSLHYFAYAEEGSSASKESMLKELSGSLGLSRTSIQKRSETVLKEILHNYAGFELTTIDAFTHKLIRSFALDLALNPGFEVTLEPMNYLREAIEELIDELQDNPQLEELLRTMTLSLIDQEKSFDIARSLLDFSKELLNEASRLRFEENAINLESVLALQKILEEKWRQKEKEVEQNALMLLDELRAAGGKEVFKVNILDHLTAMAEGRLDEPKLTGETVLKQLKEAAYFKKGKEVSATLQEKLEKDYPDIVGALHERSRIQAVSQQIGSYALMGRIFELYQSVLKRKEVLPIAEFNALISAAISDQPAPYIYERIGSKYQYFFIDEFQDTSVFQWNNLKPLLASTVASSESIDEGLAFIVGDAKQSIYRWRGGDVEQFIRLYSQGANDFSKSAAAANLDTNYRSASTLINFNNQLFSLGAQVLTDSSYQDLYRNTSRQRIPDHRSQEEGFVGVRLIERSEKSKVELQLEALREDIKRCIAAGYALRDMAVLVSKNAEASTVANDLMDKGFEVISSEALDLKLNERIKVVIALMRYTLEPSNALYAFEVVDGIERHHPERFERVQKALSDQGKRRIYSFERYLSAHEIALEELIKMNPYVFVKKVIDNLPFSTVEGAVVKAGQTDAAFCNYLLELVYERQQQRGEGVHEFLNYYDSQETLFLPLPENTEAIQITTVHKSKGLEFEVVFYPFAVERSRSLNTEKDWLEVSDLLPIRHMLLPLSSKTVKGHAPSEAIYEKERMRTELDHLNQFYVACTRAKQALFIYAETPSSSKEGIHYPALLTSCLASHFADHFNGNVADIGCLRAQGLSEQLETEDQIPFVTATEPLTFELSYPEPVLQEAQLLGTLFHEFMSHIHSIESLEGAVDSLKDKANEEQLQQCEKWANEILTHPELNTYYKKEVWAKNEAKLLDPSGSIAIPDRLVKIENDYTLIEYKTGLPSPKHLEQVNQYSDLINRLDPSGECSVKQRFILYLSAHEKELEVHSI
jgi:ATP-dependent exoDNAse (exonuclease V) beta subunit